MERIVAAAIKWKGLVCAVERPGRHPDVFRQLDGLDWTKHRHDHKQGFITSEGRFVEREEARRIADAADQIIASRVGSDGVPYKFQHAHLFSEDVW